MTCLQWGRLTKNSVYITLHLCLILTPDTVSKHWIKCICLDNLGLSGQSLNRYWCREWRETCSLSVYSERLVRVSHEGHLENKAGSGPALKQFLLWITTHTRKTLGSESWREGEQLKKLTAVVSWDGLRTSPIIFLGWIRSVLDGFCVWWRRF